MNEQAHTDPTPVIPAITDLHPPLRSAVTNLGLEHGSEGLVKAVFAIYPETCEDVARWVHEERMMQSFRSSDARPGMILHAVEDKQRDHLGPWDAAIVLVIAALIGFVVWVIAA